MNRAALLETIPADARPSAEPRPGRTPGRWAAHGVPALVALAAVLVAGLAYAQFLRAPGQLWYNPLHDRNRHYLQGLHFAFDFRQADLVRFLHDLHGARAWPPLHSLLLGLVLTVTGVEYPWAVLPSLAGWVGAALFAFLVARRAAPQGGNLAGLAAALFVLASPAHRAYGTDIMLESLGACLSLAVLYCYLRTVQEPSAWAGRWLGLALTALFFEKYNYWLLVIFGLAATEVMSRRHAAWTLARGALATLRPRAWLGAQLRHPLTYPLGLVLGLLAFIALTGGGTVAIGGRAISLHGPHNLVTAAFALLLLRLLPWWWTAGRQTVGRFDAVPRALVYWHMFPVLLWFLWPQRLGYCLWYVSPANSGEIPHHDLAGGVPFYADCLVQDFHLGLCSVLAAAALFGVALLARRRLRAGSAALFWFVLIAAVLTCVHPNRKSRFLHSWVAVGWAVAGAGLAQLVGRGRGGRGEGVRPWLGAAALGGLALAQAPGLLQERGYVPEGGPRADLVSDQGVADCYLPSLAGSRRLAIFSNLPIRFWTTWTFEARYGRPASLETDLQGFGASAADNARVFRAWLQRSNCDHVVFVHVGAKSRFLFDVPCADYQVVPGVMAQQDLFTRTGHWALPSHDCAVTVWERAPGSAAARTATAARRGRAGG